MSSISNNNEPVTETEKPVTGAVRTVIVVEDDEALNRLILKTLKREGFIIKGAPTGSRAVKLAAENTNSILLLDYLLPDMTAEDIILELNEKNLGIPFVIMTGHGDEKIAVKLMKLGAMDYIIKEKGVLELLPTVLRRVFNELNTEQKLIEAQNALRKSEACLAEAQRIAKTGNYTWDTKRDELYWSHGTCLIFGVDPSDFRSDFKKYVDFIHPEDRKRVTEIFKKALIKKTNYTVEYRIMLKDGTVRVLHDEGKISCDERNKPDCMFGVIRDITERKNLEKALFEIEERERQRIGYELHDGLGQLLTGISFKNWGLERKLQKSFPKEAEDVSEISMLIAEAKEQVSRLSKGLSPVEMDREGLMAALETLASNNEKMFGIPCVFRCDKPVLVHNKAAVIQLYRIAQEAVTNAVKHGKPDQIEISLTKKYSKITISIKDNGTGISGNPDRTNGMGLKIMRHRAGIINASFEVRQNIGEGTVVTCVFSDNSGKDNLFE